MAFNFSGKKILVTGASKGIGRYIALTLAKSDCKVYALARSKDILDELAAENSNIVPVVQNLEKWDETRATLEKLEALDGLVNNAGALEGRTPALEQTKEKFNEIINLHVLASINCIQIVAKKMIENGKARSIINISSIGSIRAARGSIGYCVSKAALDMVTKQFALELGPQNIRVNSVNSTMVLTDIFKERKNTDAIVKQFVKITPLGRIATLEEVVQPVLYLLSDYAAMVTGTTHLIDGGILCNITTKQSSS